MLRKGDAASYVFIRRAQHMAGPLREVKRDGITYKLIASIPEGNVTAKTWTFLTRDEAARSRRICVHYRVFGRDPNGPEKIDIWQTKTEGGYWVRSNSIVIPTTSDSGSVCISDPDHTDGYINVQGSFNSTVGIDTIYGNP